MSLAKPIEIIDWGLVNYREAFDRQADLVQQIAAGETSEKLIVCTHPPVVTLGRGTKPGDVFAWNGETVEVNRGGRATYHGPNQIVMYPLLYLGDPDDRFLKKAIRPKDLHAYFRVLEDSIVSVLKQYGIESQGRTLQTAVGDEAAEEATGVWIDDRKIASLGIAVRKWITSHGAAFNCRHDGDAFQGLNPCGFRSQQMTDLETVLGRKVDVEEVKNQWIAAFLKIILAPPELT